MGYIHTYIRAYGEIDRERSKREPRQLNQDKESRSEDKQTEVSRTSVEYNRTTSTKDNKLVRACVCEISVRLVLKQIATYVRSSD